MNAAELMTRAPFTLDYRARVGEAITAMVELGVRHLPLVEDGLAVAIVSDRDLRPIQGLVAAAVAQGPNGQPPAYDAPLMSIAQRHPISVRSDAPAADAIGRMLEAHVSSVVVVDARGMLVGLITTEDVLRAARDRL